MTEIPSPGGRFVPLEEVAARLALGTNEVVDLIDQGRLRGVRLGSPARWRVDADSVEAYLDDESENARRAALWRESNAASFPELWGRGDVRHED